MDPQLLKVSLNYHGQPLAQSLQQSPAGLALDLTEASHEQYMARSRSFRLEDRGQRLALQRFIVHAAPRLFNRDAGPAGPTAPVDSDVTFPIPHPLERFVPQPTVEGREKSFFQRLAPGDPMFGRVSYRNPSGLLLALLGFHPVSPGKPTFTGDLALRSICPMKEALPLDPSDKPYALGDMMIVAVVEASPDSKRVLVSMMESSLNPKYRAQIRLGRINAAEVPTEVLNPPEPARYDEALKQSSSFLNPSSVNEMAAALGLPIHGGSLCSTLKRVIPETELASGVRKRQNANWAFNHVASGIRHFKAGNNIEAFQCLNQALKIDAKNVEGLVARGALYANNGSLDRAVQDFEEALEVNPTHKNANKYIAETLVALGRNYEESGDVPKALESYDKILKFVPDHKEAMDSIVYLSAKATSSQAPIDVPIVKTTDDLDLQLPSSLGLIRDSGRRNRSCSSSLSPTRGPHPIRELHPMSVPPPVVPTSSVEVPLFPTPSSSTAMLSNMNFSVPPPGMIPFSGPSALDKDYEKRVQAFLSKTMTKENQKSRSRSRDKSSRKRSKSRDRRRRSGSREKRSRKRSRSRNRDRSRDRHRRKRSPSVGSSRDRSRREKESPSPGRVSSKSSKSKISNRHGRLASQEGSKKELRALVKRTPSPELNSIAERIKSQARALLGEDQGGEDIAAKLNTFLTEDKQTSKQEEMSHVGKVAVPTFDRKRGASPGVKAAFDVPGTPSNSSAQTRMSMKSSALPAQSWIGGKREQEIRIRLERSPVKRVVDRENSPSKSSIDSRYESKGTRSSRWDVQNTAKNKPLQIYVREVDRPDHHRDPRERSPVVERRVVRHVEPSPPPKDHDRHYQHRQRQERYGRSVDSISDLRSETLNIQLEREIIEKERAALLLAAQQYAQSRSPSMPSVDSPSPLRDLSRLSPQAIVDQARSRRRFGDSRSKSSERPKNGDSSRSRRRRERTRSRSRSRSGDRRRSRKARTFTSQPEESPKAGCSQWKTDYDYMDNVLSSVSSAVNLPEKEIIPGKNTFEEIEDFLSQAKRERKEKMSKSFQKTPTSSRR